MERLARALSEKGVCLVAKRKETKKAGLAAKVAAAGCASLLVVGCIGMGIASAGGSASDEAAVFGLGETSSAVVLQGESSPNQSVSDLSEGLAIEGTAQRDISQGIEEIEAEEEAARIAAEQAAIAQAQQAREEQLEKTGSLAIGSVDFSVGKEAFVSEWTQRIDNYLAGSPLAGYGSVFANAAWENGVDPRWSPAISNTESSKGRNCFLSHNAWGWGQSSWGSWEDAINEHVAGLASGYGHTISFANAKKYCPPNYENWYRDTLAQMELI